MKRGMDLPHTKLHPGAIRQIRQAAEDRERMRREITDRFSNAALAKKWGVHVRTIEKVLNYETARHVLSDLSAIVSDTRLTYRDGLPS